jgi:hypothetical protein
MRQPTNDVPTRKQRGIWPGEWWIVFNLYLIVIVLLAFAGSAIDI